MNLIEKYVEVMLETHGFRYKREVVDWINTTLGSRYPDTALNNWASEDNPRPVPQQVASLMRETVLPHLLKENAIEAKPAKARHYAEIINSEVAMREYVIRSVVDEETGNTISKAKIKVMTQALETPYARG